MSFSTLIPNNLLNTYNGNSFNVGIQNGIYYFRDHNYWSKPLVNTTEYINLCEQIHNMSYDSILIGGLGLGCIPYWISTNTSCSTIDVIDNNSELVSWTSNNNHLGSSVNLIEGDVFTYSTSNTYDLILMDIWWGQDSENIDENKVILIDRFKGNVNQNGNIYIVLTHDIWTKE